MTPVRVCVCGHAHVCVGARVGVGGWVGAVGFVVVTLLLLVPLAGGAHLINALTDRSSTCSVHVRRLDAVVGGKPPPPGRGNTATTVLGHNLPHKTCHSLHLTQSTSPKAPVDRRINEIDHLFRVGSTVLLHHRVL